MASRTYWSWCIEVTLRLVPIQRLTASDEAPIFMSDLSTRIQEDATHLWLPSSKEYLGGSTPAMPLAPAARLLPAAPSGICCHIAIGGREHPYCSAALYPISSSPSFEVGLEEAGLTYSGQEVHRGHPFLQRLDEA